MKSGTNLSRIKVYNMFKQVIQASKSNNHQQKQEEISHNKQNYSGFTYSNPTTDTASSKIRSYITI